MADLNPTMVKFGAPATIVRRYEHWQVQARPVQATLGSLALIARSDARAFSALPGEAFAELGAVVGDIEAVLAGRFAYDRLNYLMLMMVDKEAHFHVIPRYASPRRFAEVEFTDPGWPGPPDLGHGAEADEAVLARLVAELKSAWPGGERR